LLSVAGVFLAGCLRSEGRVLPDPISQRQAIGIVNANAASLTSTIRATGAVSGHFTTPEGRRRRFDLDGVLFLRQPDCLRFDLKSLTGTEILLGANAEYFWHYNRRDGDSYYCRPRNMLSELSVEEVPIPPERLIEALGLTPISPDVGADAGCSVLQRVVDEYQQMLFILHDGDTLVLEKEYWLDRYPPRLIRRIVFRDADGVVEMESLLGDYAELYPGGPMVPGSLDARWPEADSRLRFRAGRWKTFDDLGPASPQFTPPHKLGLRYDREDIVD